MALLICCACSAQAHTLPDDVTAPSALVLCHCLSCQQRTGSAFSVVGVFLSGSPSWLNFPSSSIMANEDSSLNQKVGFVSRTADSSKVIERAFCKACGGTVAMWRREAAENQNPQGLSIPAPNLRNFDWAKMMREQKSKVLHFWTCCAADAAFVPDGYAAYEKQVTESEEAAWTPKGTTTGGGVAR